MAIAVARAVITKGVATKTQDTTGKKKEKKAAASADSASFAASSVPKATASSAPAPEGATAKPAKEKKAAAASKKEKKVEETAPENKTTWQPIISLVFNMKNDNYEEDGSAGEEWIQDRTYFASEDALRRYLTDRINNWTDDFSTMIRGIADDSPTQIAKIIDHIVAMPFLTNHPLCPEFNICRFSAPLHQ
jgi:hypothetical protein